ncbi:MAG: transporter substrate-binding domain-containing protein [Rhizobacter sp.]
MSFALLITQRLALPVLLVLSAFAAGAGAAGAWAVTRGERLVKFEQLVVGIEPSAMPLTSDTRTYTDQGFEAKFAHDLAQALGARLVLRPIADSDIDAALQRAELDLALRRRPAADAATSTAEVQHLRIGHLIEPSVALRSDTPVRRWSDLRGRRVCVSKAFTQAAVIAKQAGAQLTVVDAPAQALANLRTGACDAAFGEEAQLRELFKHKEWQKFSATLPPAASEALVLAVPRARADVVAAARRAVAQVGDAQQWDRRHRQWVASVAFEVYLDQIGPDCH